MTAACSRCVGPRSSGRLCFCLGHLSSASVCRWKVQLQASCWQLALALPGPCCCLHFVSGLCRLDLVFEHGRDLSVCFKVLYLSHLGVWSQVDLSSLTFLCFSTWTLIFSPCICQKYDSCILPSHICCYLQIEIVHFKIVFCSTGLMSVCNFPPCLKAQPLGGWPSTCHLAACRHCVSSGGPHGGREGVQPLLSRPGGAPAA